MRIGFKITFVLSLVLGFIHCRAQNIFEGYEHLFEPVKTYSVYKIIDEIRIDGLTNEGSWQHAQWSDLFSDIEGNKKPEPLFHARFKMVWNDTVLFILAELEEPNIWAYYDKNDMIVFRENDFEVFIDPDANTHNYFEFEVNARNTLFDLFLEKPYRNGVKPNIDWNAAGFKSAIHVDGTLNNPDDTDKKWTIEMMIPFSALNKENENAFPKNGTTWKINFSRVNWQTEILNGKYTRKKNPETGQLIPEYNWVWSPQGLINMHYPERWGVACFSTNPVNSEKCICHSPDSESSGKYLWLLYYKQSEFKKKNGQYATSLSELNIPENSEENGSKFSIKLQVNENKYQATLNIQGKPAYSINDEGLFKSLKH